MKLQVNGEQKTVDTKEGKASLDLVIKELGHHPKLVVAELNGSIITPKHWPKSIVKDGDILEIVTIVGGGS